jgi:uridylate kinase
MIKATKVDGVYSKDPVKHKDAEFIESANYDDIITRNLHVMDMTAIALAKQNGLTLKVANLYKDDAILKAVL